MNKIIFALALLFCVPSWAVENVPVSREWERAGFAASGTFPMILMDNTTADKIYMTSDVAGNFVTNNFGNLWNFMNVGTTTIQNTAIAQSLSSPSILYSIGKKLIKSSDGGKHWTTLGTYASRRANSYKVIAVNRTDPDIFYFATTNGRIYRSFNGGQNIELYATPFGTNITVEFLYLNAAGTRLVAGHNGQGMVSYDLTTDVATDIDLPDTNGTYNNDFGTYDNSGTEVFCVTAGIHIKCTEDFSTWTPTADVTADTTYYIRRFAVKKLSGGSISFLTWSRKISSQYTNFTSLSTDSGSSWTDVSNNVTYDYVTTPTDVWAGFGSIGTVFSIAFDPHSDTKAMITTDWRIWVSTDGGVNWLEKDKGAQNQVISDCVSSPRMTNGITRLFCSGMDIGLLYSDDIGDTWTPTFPNTSNGAPQGFAVAGNIWRVITSGNQAAWDAGTGHVVATSSYWTDSLPRVIYSNDNGETWTITTSGLPTTILSSSGTKHDAAWGVGYARALAKCAANEDILALGIDGYSATENGGIFISTNGGVDWARTSTQPDQWKTYNGIAFDPTDATCNTILFTEFFYDSPDLPATWRTTDRGSTWTNVENDIGIYDIAFASSGTAYKVGLDTNPVVDYSLDGVTWANMARLNTTNQIANGLYVNGDIVIVGVDDGTNTGVSQGEGATDGSGAGGGSVFMTGNASSGANATFYNITGNLPSPAGVTAITMVFDYEGNDWIIIGTDGAGIFRLKANDTSQTTISNVSW